MGLFAVLVSLTLILGDAPPPCYGYGHARVTRFLLTSLKEATKSRYETALQHLHDDLLVGSGWRDWSDKQKDAAVSDWLVEAHENGESKSDYALALSALRKVEPDVPLKTAWKVYDVWSQLEPAQQAPAYPPEIIESIAVSFFMVNRPSMGVAVMICYCGLLRVSEALNLRWDDIVFVSGTVVLCLGQAKRGLEQKVVITNSSMVTWLCMWRRRCSKADGTDKAFEFNYSTLMRWLAKFSAWLCLPVRITSHTFRRSGASQLSRLGMPMADLLSFGRWASVATASLYIRKGETALARFQNIAAGLRRDTIEILAHLCPQAWKLLEVFEEARVELPSVNRVNDAVLNSLENIFGNLFRVNG